MSQQDWEAQYKALLSSVGALGMGHFLAPAKTDASLLRLINVSFSSSGEDLWLRQFMKARFRSQRPGLYIDVGSNHPVSTSNTYLFYIQGWRGICIDANLSFAEAFKIVRPRDVFVNAAVSDVGQSFYFAEKQGPLGNKEGRVVLDHKNFPPNYAPPVEVPARTLAGILREHVPPGTTIDFMTMDLEDSELPALRSNDWQTYKPRVILIECGTGFDPLNPYAFPTIGFLQTLGYRYRGFSCNNVLLTAPDFDEINALVQAGQA